MSEGPLVSVIVPVYKVEKYIRRTVSSILDQDYRNLEVILVDDGSPDGCPAILDEFAASDGRIKVIHQANSGVSSARNAGLSAASGEYITFIDGDDWVERDYVSYFTELLEETVCDIGVNLSVIGGANMGKSAARITRSEKVIEWIYTGVVNVAVWNKMYRSNVIKSHRLCFDPDIWYGEGMLFNIEALQLVEEVVVGCRPVYHQVFNPNSAMRSFSVESNMCGLRSLDIQRNRWRKVTPEIEAAWRFHRYSFNRSIVGGLVRAGIVAEHKDLYKTCVRNLRRQASITTTIPMSLRERFKWMLWIVAPGLTAKIAALNFRRRVITQS